ncbi:hypothetical protein ACLOJK_006670 [Asimina triloba]
MANLKGLDLAVNHYRDNAKHFLPVPIQPLFSSMTSVSSSPPAGCRLHRFAPPINSLMSARLHLHRSRRPPPPDAIASARLLPPATAACRDSAHYRRRRCRLSSSIQRPRSSHQSRQ